MKDGDPRNLRTQIHCISCREPLWTQRILMAKGGRPTSTETLPVAPAVGSFDTRRNKCPYCGERFYTHGKKGTQMYLIKDLNCGILRLI